MRDELERELGKSIKTAPEQDPPEWLADSIMRRVAPMKPRRAGLLSRIRENGIIRFSPAAMALAFGCVMLAFVGGFVSGGRWERVIGIQKMAQAFPAVQTNAEATFLLGRSLLTAGLEEEAAGYLSLAVDKAPLRTEYRIWLAKAYAAAGQTDEELRQYKLAAAIDRESALTRRRLADGFMRAGMYEEAAAEYGRILAIRPGDKSALFKRAAAMRKIGQNEKAGEHLKRLLANGTDTRTRVEAAAMLNGIGDYDYRPTVIGKRRIAVKTPDFRGGELTEDSRAELGRLAAMLANSPDTVLQVVAYVSNDKNRARRRALAVKNEIMRRAPEIDPQRIRTSWFGSAEELKSGEKLEESLRIFGTPMQIADDKGVTT
jgi:tetratricopeptide (TPR) repeat protein